MNILFGIWRPGGPAVQREELEAMAEHTRRFASDGEWFEITSEIAFGIQAQYTHARSRLEAQPVRDAIGNVLVYDGRLDNYRDLASELGLCDEETSDSEIILRAYERWGEGCFVRLIGDWALVLWDSRIRKLYLARDHAGTRLLHYTHNALGTVKWATYLDSYIGNDLFEHLDPVYMTAYLAMLPCYGRTPYRQIEAVLPGHFVKVSSLETIRTQFWSPTVQRQRSFRSADDLKAEFLHLFEQSVARRTSAGAPVLAQLSGGMDSTSIVCVADRLRKCSSDVNEPLDTLSFFDDSEPTWNERPYFTLVEAKRGRQGFHLDTSLYPTSFERFPDNAAQYLYPGIEHSHIRRDRDIYSLIGAGGYRAILSGIGGDEFTGGILNPSAEIADLVLAGRFFAGAKDAIAWCLALRLSLVQLLSQTVSFVRCHLDSSQIESSTTCVPWLTKMASQHVKAAFSELPLAHFKPFSVRSVTAEQSLTWWFALRNQPHLKPSEVYRYEYRYPYLDRDFLEFLLQVPTDQLAQPGRRRALMRLALRGIVPEEILERRRKAYLLASRLRNISQLAPQLLMNLRTSLLAEYGYIDKTCIERALTETVRGNTTHWWGLLLRFAWLETWLRYRANFKSRSGINSESCWRDGGRRASSRVIAS